MSFFNGKFFKKQEPIQMKTIRPLIPLHALKTNICSANLS